MAFFPFKHFSARQMVLTIAVGIFGVALGMLLGPTAVVTEASLGAFPWGGLLGFAGLVAGAGGLIYGLRATENAEKLSQEVGYVYQRLSAMEKYQSEQHIALQSTIQTSLHSFLEQNPMAQADGGLNPQIVDAIQQHVNAGVQRALPDQLFHALRQGVSEVTAEMGVVATLVQDLAASVGEHEQVISALHHSLGDLNHHVDAVQKQAAEADEKATRATRNPSKHTSAVHINHDNNDDVFAVERALAQQPVERPKTLSGRTVHEEHIVAMAAPTPQESPYVEAPMFSRDTLENMVREQVAKLVAEQTSVVTPTTPIMTREAAREIVKAVSVPATPVSPAPIISTPRTEPVAATQVPQTVIPQRSPTIVSGSQLEMLGREALKTARERLERERAEKMALRDEVVASTHSPSATTPQQAPSELDAITSHNPAPTHPAQAVASQTVWSQAAHADGVMENSVHHQSQNLMIIPETASQEAIAQALREDKIELHLQPIMQLPQRKAFFYETLSRLRLNEDDVVLPAQFLPVVAEKGLSSDYDIRVAERVMVIARHLASRGSEALVSVNIAAETLADGTYLKALDRLIAENGAVRNRIVLEIGQGTIRSLSADRLIALKGLSHRGIRLCIDRVNDARIDAQTLAQIGISFIKLPVGFLIGQQASRFEIAPQDIATLFKRNGIQLIAERVETEEQVRELLDLDVPLAQGHVFAPPKPVRSDVFAVAATPNKSRLELKPDVQDDMESALSASERQSLRAFLSRGGSR
jgi:EAL domain-containing protein (putative c-di-GMP-specific phosphodiesterase class I)